MVAVLHAGVMLGHAEPAKVDDPGGLLRKPIADKFDDFRLRSSEVMIRPVFR